jgi:hypothetical protein
MSRSIRAHDLENSEYARVLAPEDLAAAAEDLAAAAAVKRLSRYFRGLSIFDFFDSIDPYRKSRLPPHQSNYAKDKLAAGDRARLRWIKSRQRFCSLVATWPR